MASIEIPEPLLKVTTEESWNAAGWTGYRTYTTIVSIGDVVLLERKFDDEHDDYGRMCSAEAEERTVKEFAERLKEVLGFE